MYIYKSFFFIYFHLSSETGPNVLFFFFVLGTSFTQIFYTTMGWGKAVGILSF